MERKMGKRIRILPFGIRDYAKELKVQRELERQIKARNELMKIQEMNKKRFKELHPDSKARIAKGLGKLGLGVAKELKIGLKEFKRFRRRKPGAIGRAIREVVG